MLPAALVYVAFILPLVAMYYRSPRRRETAEISAVLFVVPLIVPVFGFIGAQRSLWNIVDNNNAYVLHFKEDRASDQQGRDAVQILRSFDKGLLVRHPESDSVELIRWDALRSVVRQKRSDLPLVPGR
jgi:hypothetical protein